MQSIIIINFTKHSTLSWILDDTGVCAASVKNATWLYSEGSPSSPHPPSHHLLPQYPLPSFHTLSMAPGMVDYINLHPVTIDAVLHASGKFISGENGKNGNHYFVCYFSSKNNRH